MSVVSALSDSTARRLLTAPGRAPSYSGVSTQPLPLRRRHKPRTRRGHLDGERFMKQRNLAPLAAALFAAMTMGTCSDNNDNKRSIGQDGVGANRHQAAQDVKTAAGNAAAKQSDSVNDAAITTTVNAELARDG